MSNNISVFVGTEGKPIVMEVIGRKGQKISEYLPKATESTDNLPYYEIQESVTL